MNTVNSENIALLIFAFFALSIGRKIKNRNNKCCHLKCIAGIGNSQR